MIFPFKFMECVVVKQIALPLSALSALTLSASVFAAAGHGVPLDVQVKRLSAQTNRLQREVKILRKQLVHQNKQHAKNYWKHGHQPRPVSHEKKSHAASAYPLGHFVTITTSPFLGKNVAFDASNLLYEVSSNNEDLRLLQQKKKDLNKLAADGYKMTRPMVELSGGVVGQVYSAGGFNTVANDDVSLSTAELDLNAMASSWASAFMSLAYDGAPVSTGNRAPNARIYLKRGFLTLGNLNVTPLYGSIGLMYAPFGRYSSGMLSTPLTLSLGRIRSEVALLGVSFNNGLFASVYGFAGSRTSGGSGLFRQGGVNAGFKHKLFAGKGKVSVGAGWVSNIADSEGMQGTGKPSLIGPPAAPVAQFSGFASATGSNALVHNVDGMDFYGKFGYGPVTLMAEYLGAARRFGSTDLTFNGAGAEPRAMHAEINYALPFSKKRGTTLGFAYGETWQALGLNLPKQSYTVFLSTSLLRETIESIEYRHDTDYAATDVANGSTLPIAGVTNTAFRGSGRGRNSVIGQVGVYF